MTTRLLAVSVALAFAWIPVHAQVALDSDPGSSVRTRSDLQQLLQLYDEVLQSPAYSNDIKETTRKLAARIRDRLTNGDFRVGDRVVLFVQGEPDIPDTVPVEAGPSISLPLFGEIALTGVLRSEIASHIAEAMRQYIRDPVVRAEGLMRISVQGSVGRPGFYVVPAGMLLSETLMMAGGPTANASLDGLRIERGPEVVIDGAELQELLRRGDTLDQLNLQAGDQVFLPDRSGGIFSNLGVVVGVITSITVLVVRLAG